MKIERSSDTTVTDILQRPQPRANFTTAQVRPLAGKPEFALLPDMTEMNARQVVETIASTLTNR